MKSKIIMFKNYFFAKKTYPVFLKEVKNAYKNGSIIVHWHNNNEQLQILFLIDGYMITFEKEKNTSLKINTKILHENFKDFTDKEEMRKKILELKEEANLISSQHIIEYIGNNIKNSISYYQLSRKDLNTIFEVILTKKEIFKNNPPATILEHETNKWID